MSKKNHICSKQLAVTRATRTGARRVCPAALRRLTLQVQGARRLARLTFNQKKPQAHRIVAHLEGLARQLLDDDVALHARIAGDQPRRRHQRLRTRMTNALMRRTLGLLYTKFAAKLKSVMVSPSKPALLKYNRAGTTSACTSS